MSPRMMELAQIAGATVNFWEQRNRGRSADCGVEQKSDQDTIDYQLRFARAWRTYFGPVDAIKSVHYHSRFSAV